MKIIQQEDLLILEFENLNELQNCLNNRLTKLDSNLQIKDYKGFNYRYEILLKFCDELLKKILIKYPSKYVIGYVKDDENTLKHELKHYRYFADKNYRDTVKKFFSDPIHENYLKRIKNMGYKSSVIFDEAQAFWESEIN